MSRKTKQTHTWLLMFLGAWPAASALVCPVRAQTPSSPVTGEAELDLRTRIAAVGASGSVPVSKVYTTALRLEAALAPGVRAQAYGTRKFGAFAVQQALMEKSWNGKEGNGSVQRVQVGLIRLPFGIYNQRETYASGLIDYPLARGDYAYHSVDWGAPGIAVSGGPATLQIEAAGFSGRGTGIWDNQNRVRGAALRAQTYAGDAILGLSRWDGALQDDPSSPACRPVHLTGLDLRYTKTQLLVRGEYLFGTLAGDRMRGWYLDGYYRLPGYERWSLVARVERLKPGGEYPESRQLTLGARCVVTPEWTLAANWRHNNGPFYAATWTPSALRGGDLYLQAYHRVDW